jgi:hypothetical protein
MKTTPSAPQRVSPAFVTPMAAQVVKRLPEGDDWVYELKFDGYRTLVIKDGHRVELRSRKDKDLTGMYRGIAAAGSRLNADQAVVDGEIVALDAQGSPSFQALQHRGSHPGHQIVFYAFDLLHLDGKDLLIASPGGGEGSSAFCLRRTPPRVKAFVGKIRGYKLSPFLGRDEALCLLELDLARICPSPLDHEFVAVACKMPLRLSEERSPLVPAGARSETANEVKVNGRTQRKHQTHGAGLLIFVAPHEFREGDDLVGVVCPMHLLEAGIEGRRKLGQILSLMYWQRLIPRQKSGDW